jgi:hypothetical protein
MKRLVVFDNAESRPTPLLLLAALREIDPRVELVYVGEGKWWLGGVNPNDERTRRAEILLKQMEWVEREEPALYRRPSVQRSIMAAKLGLQGFARIEQYTANGEPSGTVLDSGGHPCTIVEDFRERQWNWQRDGGEAKVAERNEFNLGVHAERESNAQFQQYLAEDGRAHYAREMRGRVVVGVNGLRLDQLREPERGSPLILPFDHSR